ncbi:hypothetical protein HBN50_08805 [Halobacteriovorax sp. GB3]|uniref:hypothetical protein n=1 Tax=Halobacteriovorax sp. GB3 TaxID=2719615 RepID=UPI0023621F22|nr:hypothetical protein [Halobacteriovorax sp. GB3]MDD0853195.1 hypothetical protein [Halobacteriovorax sp. GB3]
MKSILIVFLGLFCLSSEVFSMGLFRPRQISKPAEPAPSEPDEDNSREPGSQAPIEPTSPTYNISFLEDATLFEEVPNFIGAEVDSQFSTEELLKERSFTGEHFVDQCQSSLVGRTRFADRISFYVDQHMFNVRPYLSHLAPYYSVPNKMDDHIQTGLAHFPLCHSTRSSLSSMVKKVPSNDVIEMLNEFEDKVNDLREKTIGGDEIAKVDLVKTWSKFMGCLSYVESLTTADASSSERVANKYAPSNYRKPAGVKFYEDPYQSSASKLNIGLYQFTPNWTGNIGACLKHWNQLYPSCQVNEKSNQGELIKMFGSSFQGMNSFCGVNKVAQTFAIQVNTSQTKSTHPSNRTSKGLKDKDQRCVSPFIYAGYGYNHFGPLQNSTGSNLKKLMTCTLR